MSDTNKSAQPLSARMPKDYEMAIAVSIPTKNTFQAFQEFHPLNYIQGIQSPPLRQSINQTPQTPSKALIQIANSSNDKSIYITKPINEHLILTAFHEVSPFDSLNIFVQTLFSQYNYWCADDPNKNQHFYELILINSKLVEIYHNPSEEKDPQKIQYSNVSSKRFVKVQNGLPYIQRICFQ